MSAHRPPLILTSFAYGTGPYLRTTEWALTVADLLENQGGSKHRVIVPLVYGNKQKMILKEALGGRMEDVILDKIYGALLAPLFYSKEPYAIYLKRWIDLVDTQSALIRDHLQKTYGDAIALELHRSPRMKLNMAPTFALTFGWQTDILTQAKGNPEIEIPEVLLDHAISKFQSIESSFQKTFITDPGTFSHIPNFQFSPEQSRKVNSQFIPPTIPSPQPTTRPMEQGIYVTVTGIPGLERLFVDVKSLGMTIYSNDPGEAKKTLPDVIGNPAIKLHFARSGWSSIWLSLLTETPFIATSWDPKDDPEIYFNNQCIEALGIGTVYHGQSFEELIDEGEKQKIQMQALRSGLQRKYGTLNGTTMASAVIIQSQL